VCVEKPVSHCIWEGRKAVEAARKYNRLVQADLDFRSRPGIGEAFEYLRSGGAVGKIVYIRALDYKRRESMGKVTGPQQIPANIDYNLWTGPTPLRPLMRKTFHYDWHWQWTTGNGEIANNGAHHLDMARWALGTDQLPRTVMSFGGRFGYVDDGETPNTMVAVYDYDGIPVIYEVRGLPEKSGSANMDDFLGETADGKPVRLPHGKPAPNGGIVVFCEGGYYHDGVVYDNGGQTIKKFTGQEIQPQKSFIAAVRSGKIADLKTDIEQGHRSAAFCHMGNVSFVCGGRRRSKKRASSSSANAHAAKALDRDGPHLTDNGVDTSKTSLTVGPP
jgi:predicted dehydrogenase